MTRSHLQLEWSFLRRHKVLFAAVLLARGLWELIPLQVPVLAGVIVDGLHGKGKGMSLFGFGWSSRAPLEVLQIASLGLLALAVAYGVSAYVSTLLVAHLDRAFVNEQRRAVFTKVMGLSLDHYQRHGAGELLDRALQDTARMRGFTGQVFIRSVTNVVRAGYPLVMLFVIDPVLALIALSIVPPQWVATEYLRKRLHAVNQEIHERHADLTTVAKEHLDGVEAIQALHAETAAIARFDEAADRLEAESLTSERITARIRCTIWFTTSLGLALVWWQGGLRVLEGTMTLGTLLVFTGFTDYAYRPFRRFTDIVNTYHLGLVSLERIQNILATPSSVPVHSDARPIRIQEGKITFRDVSFTYGLQAVLQQVNLTIEPRQFTAFVGRNGAGKSSLMRLIPRLYDPTHGRVLIDGQALETVTLQSLRSQVALVPQQLILFSGTILENLLMARPDASLRDIEEACAVSGALEFIETFEDGFHTRVGRAGRSLSTGQLQRVAIARALLTRPRILLLDEPTSAQDTESEAVIVETLRRLRGEVTVVVVAHRQSTICLADKIVLLDAGRVVAEGTHNELLLRCEQYAELFATEGQSSVARTRDGSTPQRDGDGGRVVAESTPDELLLREQYAELLATEGESPVSRTGGGSTPQTAA